MPVASITMSSSSAALTATPSHGEQRARAVAHERRGGEGEAHGGRRCLTPEERERRRAREARAASQPAPAPRTSDSPTANATTPGVTSTKVSGVR
jgi:hypothetical protein